MATKTQILANARYRDKSYDVISFSVKKGKRNDYKNLAEERGLSLSMLIQKSIEEYIQNHEPCYNAETIQAIEEAERGEGLSRTFTTVDELMEDLMSDA